MALRAHQFSPIGTPGEKVDVTMNSCLPHSFSEFDIRDKRLPRACSVQMLHPR